MQISNSRDLQRIRMLLQWKKNTTFSRSRGDMNFALKVEISSALGSLMVIQLEGLRSLVFSIHIIGVFMFYTAIPKLREQSSWEREQGCSKRANQMGGPAERTIHRPNPKELGLVNLGWAEKLHRVWKWLHERPILFNQLFIKNLLCVKS